MFFFYLLTYRALVYKSSNILIHSIPQKIMSQILIHFSTPRMSCKRGKISFLHYFFFYFCHIEHTYSVSKFQDIVFSFKLFEFSFLYFLHNFLYLSTILLGFFDFVIQIKLNTYLIQLIPSSGRISNS